MLILLDQDGVLADFENAFHAASTAPGQPHPALPPSARQSFHVRDDYPKHLRAMVERICTEPGFFPELPPIPGAIVAVQALLAAGHELRICTSPLHQHRHCMLEKYECVERHLGAEFVGHMILTKDKTLVHGDVLIDDKPAITGARRPDWRHVLYDQPYNRHVDGPRMTWASWREVLRAR